MEKLWLPVLCVVAGACYHVSPLESDTQAYVDSDTDTADIAADSGRPSDDTGVDSYTHNTVWDSESNQVMDTTADTIPADTETLLRDADVVDTLFGNREPHFCDNLGWDDCRDASTDCGRMYMEEARFVEPVGVTSSCGGESLFFGCAPLMYCYEDFRLAFDPNGKCWLMPTGCIPDEPGWRPAVDDEFCREPIVVSPCIE